jgi:hypothetical protein
MTPKGANLQATDLLEISEVSGTGYITKSITGQEIINAGGGGGSQNLQQVTDIGATTTNAIDITAGANESTTVSGIDIITENTLASTYVKLENTGVLALKTGAEESTLKNTAVTNVGVVLEFPNKTTGSYTIATTADVSDLQSKAVVVSTNQTAVNDGSYTVVANSTFTDPSPIEGKGYRVFVRNGTATINSVGYTEGTTILRLFYSGSWVSYTSVQSNPFPLFGAGITNVPGAITPTTRFVVFLSLITVAAENQRQIPVPYDVTFKNFFCFFGVGASQPATGSLVLTIRKNGVDTAITITIPAGTSSGTFSDTTNSVSFAAGDLISVKAVNNASATSGNITAISLGTI